MARPLQPLKNISNLTASCNARGQSANKMELHSSRIRGVSKKASLRVSTLNKVFGTKKSGVSAPNPENLNSSRDIEWKRAMMCSSSSTSSYTSEEDDVTRRAMYARICKRLNSYGSDTESDEEMNFMEMYYGRTSRVGLRQQRHLRNASSTSDDSSIASPLSRRVRFEETRECYSNSDITRANLSLSTLPQDGAQTRLRTAGVVRHKSQLQLVVCGSSKKLTVTVLGLRSLPQPPSPTSPPTFVYLKMSLSPDNENRVRHKTTPEHVTTDSATLHETFTFDICRRDANRRLLISAWSKAADHDRSNFVGCMSFGIKNIVNSQEIVQGWYYFLRETLGRKKHLKVKSLIANEHSRRQMSPRRTKSRDHRSSDRCANKPTQRRRNSSRSGSSDSSLASVYNKTACNEKCECNSCVLDEEETCYELSRQQRRLVKLNKRRRVSGGYYQTLESKRQKLPTNVMYDFTEERAQNDDDFQPECVISPPVSAPAVSRAVEKRSCDVTGTKVTKVGLKTPTGRRHIRHKSYSSNDLILSRLSYCPDHDDDDVFLDDDNSCKPIDQKSREVQQLKSSAVCRPRTRSAKIVSPSNSARTDETNSNETKEESFVTGSLLPNRYGDEPRRRKLTEEHVLNRSTSCKEASKESKEASQKDLINFPNTPEILEGSTSPEVDDRGYHSDTGTSSGHGNSDEDNREETNQATTSKSDSIRNHEDICRPNKPTAINRKRRTRLSLDFIPNSPYTGSKAMERLLKHCDVICENANENINKENASEKSKQRTLTSIMTWLQRKGVEGDSKLNPQTKSISSVLLNKQKNAGGEQQPRLKRSSSMRKSKRNTCESNLADSQTLAEVLRKKGGIHAFRNFLRSEYSEENIDFWTECESYKQLKANKLRKVATKIYERFLAPDSPNEINIDGKTRESTLVQLSNPNTDTFNEAQNRIYKLMESDSFRRFLASDFAK